MGKKLCYDEINLIHYSMFNLVIREDKMAMITTICAVGTAIAAVLFSLWMIKQLFASN
ncbi:MAG: hypothetical protein AWT59_1572 [Candidatus Gallionella acididurans]|uniref:Uncharacterized protein n=1 Tax=Candidatus Gallionella acididurans TaxID=1796491 RepID=A0A139BTU1_9PROT|nr:MAG: hypothetical protein AWT59_1572 [Candidatus Gallionella acididurans]